MMGRFPGGEVSSLQRMQQNSPLARNKWQQTKWCPFTTIPDNGKFSGVWRVCLHGKMSSANQLLRSSASHPVRIQYVGWWPRRTQDTSHISQNRCSKRQRRDKGPSSYRLKFFQTWTWSQTWQPMKQVLDHIIQIHLQMCVKLTAGTQPHRVDVWHGDRDHCLVTVCP